MQVNGHKLSLSTILSVIGMVAALGGSWFVWGQQAGKLTEKVQTIEERQKEDRAAFRRDQNEIKQDVKQVASDVQTILRKLDSMEAVNRAERRREPR